MVYFGPPVLPPIAGTSIPTVEALSRDIGTTLGGTTITVWGRGFDSTAAVTFGGHAATVQSITFNKITVKTPAIVASQIPVDVVVNQQLGSSTLTGSFEYLPKDTLVYASATFEDGTSGSFNFRFNGAALGLSTCSVVPIPFPRKSSTKCVWSAVSGTQTHEESSVYVDCANNPMATQPNGLFMRWFICIPTSTGAIVSQSQGQIKTALMRVNNQASGTIIPGIGAQFGTPPSSSTPHFFIGTDDAAELVMTGSGLSWQTLRDGNWIELMHQLTRITASTGVMATQFRTWVNGKRESMGTVFDIGGDKLTDTYQPRFGCVYNQGFLAGEMTGSDPLSVYIDEAFVANGFIEATE